MSRLDRYIFRQLAVALIAVTVGLALLIWLTQSLRFIELVLDRGLSFAVFLELTGLLMPSFFAVILPIATFVVTLFSYVRLSTDRELVVMRAAGLSQWQLSRPALYLAVIATGLCFMLQLWLVPMSHTAFRTWQFEIRNQMAAILVQEGVFSSVGDDLTVYARLRERDGTLRGILVQDSRDAGAPVTILAEEGRITQTPSGPRVILLNGQRQQVERVAPPAGSPPGTPQTLRLAVLTFGENSVDLARTGRSDDDSRNRDSRERSVSELLHPDPAENLPERDIRKFYAEAHQRLSNPLTTLSFALVGLATALASGFRRHGGGFAIGVGVGTVVGLLALGLAVGNLAARNNALVPLIWLHAVGPGLVSAWVLSGMPGWPRRRRLAAA
ncbi:putative membrane spanning protein [Roseomonas mucosa]|uniref:LPS export ABC transporter permease LptF n=2 Tax=Roseomonas TaxID=125216 RepID=A0A1L7AC80_9PROT|nr:LPS export ABC transporter permease LptF [Roseomonas gilardii]APT56361.1 LPS export ABC transporter permease LptF [Roseomonas gilardii]AWV22173.1 putative membrane spanning protein [Roseomonas mucosa]MDT8332055.1 LPS export ABC transporter permease LptF [Roseomonas gilardii]PZR13692.1 MAG: LPS export ABC transporter permease LptF [Azospirillum brasilense]